MKILEVNKLYYPWVGGVEKVVQQIAEGLNGENDFETEVLCCQPKGQRKVERVRGVRVWRASSLGIFWGMPLSFDFFRLFRTLSKKADIIDFHHPFPLGDLALFLFRPKAKLIVHYHSDIVRQKIFSSLFKPLLSNTLEKAQKILVSNPNLVKNSPYLRKFKEKCEVVSYGVDLKKFRCNEVGSHKRVGEIRKKYSQFVLFVGRLSYYKGLEYLIEAMKAVGGNLVIVGKGPLESKLKHKTQKLGIEDKTSFLPYLEQRELINFYQACSLFVLPSIFKSEAFGIVLIEAMACGKPIISTELGTGTSWINVNGETGLVVLPRDSRSLAEGIKKILENKNLAKFFGKNALKRAEEQFSLQGMLERVQAIYQETLTSNF